MAMTASEKKTVRSKLRPVSTFFMTTGSLDQAIPLDKTAIPGIKGSLGPPKVERRQRGQPERGFTGRCLWAVLHPVVVGADRPRPYKILFA